MKNFFNIVNDIFKKQFWLQISSTYSADSLLHLFLKKRAGLDRPCYQEDSDMSDLGRKSTSALETAQDHKSRNETDCPYCKMCH